MSSISDGQVTPTERSRMATLSRITTRTTRTDMGTRNPITRRPSTRTDTRNRTSRIDTPIRGRTRRIDITRMAIALVLATNESQSGGVNKETT